MIAAFGEQRALRIFTEGQAAVEFCKGLIENEKIDCHLHKNGRMIAAWSAQHFAVLSKEIERRRTFSGLDADIIPAAEVTQHVGSDRYQGAALMHREASLHGALFHRGLLERVQAAGAQVATGTPVKELARTGSGFSLTTSRGQVRAGQVLVATNGYTGDLTPQLRRRLVPVNSFGIVTELLSDEKLSELFPARRPCVDTLRLAHGFRPSPYENRLVFGTRPAVYRGDLAHAGAHLRREMLRVFPSMENVQLTHAWTGHVAFPFEFLPHVGVWEGAHFAVGYNGYGVSLAPYLGHKAALRMLGDEEGQTIFADLPFTARPLYFGKPWFLAPALLYHRFRDWLAD